MEIKAIYPAPTPEATNWEAKYNEAVAQHKFTIDAHVALKNNVDTAMQVVSEMLFDEAEKHGRCEDAFDFVDSINDALPRGFYIPLRKRKFTVSTTITGTISVTHEVEVEARNQQEADDLVSDCPDDYFDPDDVLREENIRYISIDNIEVEVE